MDNSNNPNLNNQGNAVSEEVFQQLKKGNRSLREGFIGEHEGFVLNCVSSHVGDSTIKKNSEEFHVGLFAFIYSIDKFSQGGYKEFIEFAENTIKKWLDENRVKNLKSFREDVTHLKHKLWEFGITVPLLISSTPKDNFSIKVALKTAHDVLNSEPLFANLKMDKNLSVEELAELNNIISRKVKKNKKYTITLVLILKSNLDVLKNYLKNIELDDTLADNIGTVIDRSKDTAIYMTGYGRFNMTKSFGNVVDLGKMVYFTKSKLSNGFKGPALKYSVAVAGIALALIVSFAGFKFIKGEFDKSGSKEANSDVVRVADKDKDIKGAANSKTDETASNTDEKDQQTDDKTAQNDNSDGNKTQSEPANTQDTKDQEKNTPAKSSEKPLNTQIPQTSMKPTEVSKPSSSRPASILPTPKKTTTSVKPLPSVRPTKPKTSTVSAPTQSTTTNRPVVEYATTRATGAPGAVEISSDYYEVKVGQSYTLHIIMPGGNNGTLWKLYENGRLTLTKGSQDSTPEDQRFDRLIFARKSGTYTYRCDVSNSFGTTSSSTITVVVK
ncbi:MAG: hypothetical protein Q8942_10230 [Bacillota bacterium]|nr:hypothetical protein [Bacillota bacterium]